MSAPDPLKPSARLLAKLGSIAVHADEMVSPKGHAFDGAVMQALINDPEVVAWMKAMDGLCLIPKKR